MNWRELVAIVAVDGVCQTDNQSQGCTRLCSSSDDRETNGMSRECPLRA